MKIFLASTFSDSAHKFQKEFKVKKGTVMFIANPGDPFKGRKYWIEKDRNAFVNLGHTIIDIDLRTITIKDFLRCIQKSDILHICGGSALYILDLLKQKGVFNVLSRTIQMGEIIYTGTSAGTMIMAPDISFACDDEDEQEAGMIDKVKDKKGFGFIPFYVMCHAQEKYYIPSTKKAIERLPKNKLPILFLNDGMAIITDKLNFKIV